MEHLSSVTQLVEHHLRDHIGRWCEKVERRNECKVPSLISLTADATVQSLEQEEDIHAATSQMVEDYTDMELQHVLRNPKASYPLLRAFHDLTLPDEGCRAVDLDEAIIRNERFLLGRDNEDGKYLVSLEDFVKMLPDKTFINPNIVSFVRKDPPKGGLEALNHLRKRTVQLLSSSEAFSQTFDRVTQGILRGLDWSNVILAGDMALFTLLHTDPAQDDKEAIQHNILTMYIYGLDPDGANQKAEQIYNSWNYNLPISIKRILVKMSRILTYRPDYPQRIIQIRLKLYPTPTDVLLSLNLDPCAIAYNGSSVFMLPRCARAIETGYTTFTKELLYGHHLSESGRLASSPVRLFKYASRGFGLRFQPSYAKSLEADQSTQDESASRSDITEQRDRYSFGPVESGLLTLKRVAYLGQDYMHRLNYGSTTWTTPLNISSHRDEGEAGLGEVSARNEQSRFNGELIYYPWMDDENLMDKFHVVNPHMAFDNFETFSRFCEAWHRTFRKEASLRNEETDDMTAEIEPRQHTPYLSESGGYDLMLELTVGSHEPFDDELFTWMASAINTRLQTSREWFRPDFRDYLTRRIRTKVFGDDFQTIREKQITFPILINHELETFLEQILREHVPNAPMDCTPLIPVHDTTMYDAATLTLPSLRDVTGKRNNFRYWVITSQNQWAGQHKVMDEVSDVLWCLHMVFSTQARHLSSESDDNPDSQDATRALRREFSTRDPELLNEDRIDLWP